MQLCIYIMRCIYIYICIHKYVYAAIIITMMQRNATGAGKLSPIGLQPGRPASSGPRLRSDQLEGCMIVVHHLSCTICIYTYLCACMCSTVYPHAWATVQCAPPLHEPTALRTIPHDVLYTLGNAPSTYCNPQRASY
jgi:hypothetical protein